MSFGIIASDPNDLYKVFNYEVDFVGKHRVARAGFMSVSGIKILRQTLEVPEGGYNDQPHTIPKGVRYQPIVMERGMSRDTDLLAAFSGKYGKKVLVFVRDENLMIVKIKLKDRSGRVVRTHELQDVLMTTYETGDFNAMQSATMLERITLTYMELVI